MTIEHKPTIHFYPLRPSELVANTGFLADVQALPLNAEERQAVTEFEKDLYEKFRKAKSPKTSDHTIYPGAFQTPEGMALFSLIYLKKGFWQEQRKALIERGVNLKKRKERDKAYEALFKGLVEEAKQNPLQEDRDIEKTFAGVGLTKIPKKIRELANAYSQDWAQETFIEQFRESGGDLDKVDNPVRVSRIVSPAKLRERLKRFRELKQEIKDKKDSCSEAEGIVLEIYEREVNYKIADLYSDLKVDVKDEPRFSIPNSPRTMQRIDRFIAGVGHDGSAIRSIPIRLEGYAQARAEATNDREYSRYNEVMVNSQQMQIICDAILAEYGILNNPWSTEVTAERRTLVVNNTKRVVRIPEKYKKGLLDALSVASHEIEGHVLRHVNKKLAKLPFALARKAAPGRESILSEAAAKYVENKTGQAIGRAIDGAQPYYYLALKEKLAGGSFKECFKAFFDAYVRLEKGMLPEQALAFNEVYENSASYVYPRVLRIFRRHTPLNDASSKITTSDQLDYIEQELVGEKLAQVGQEKLIFIAGVDLYLARDLMRLGILDLSKVQGPKMVVAEKLWPQIKGTLDSGKSVDEALALIKTS